MIAERAADLIRFEDFHEINHAPDPYEYLHTAASDAVEGSDPIAFMPHPDVGQVDNENKNKYLNPQDQDQAAAVGDDDNYHAVADSTALFRAVYRSVSPWNDTNAGHVAIQSIEGGPKRQLRDQFPYQIDIQNCSSRLVGGVICQAQDRSGQRQDVEQGGQPWPRLKWATKMAKRRRIWSGG